MKVGMLWLQNDPKKTLEQKVEEAAAYYAKKYGAQPNLCYVNSCMLNGNTLTGAVELRPNRYILPNHFWIGVADKEG